MKEERPLNANQRPSGLMVFLCFGCGEYQTVHEGGTFYRHKNPQTGEICIASGSKA